MPDYFGIIGLIAGQLVALPQLVKIIKTKQVAAVSLWTYIVLVFTCLMYALHARLIGDTIFTITNSLSFFSNGTILVLLLKYRRRN